jgi:hypothetical protein
MASQARCPMYRNATGANSDSDADTIFSVY